MADYQKVNASDGLLDFPICHAIHETFGTKPSEPRKSMRIIAETFKNESESFVNPVVNGAFVDNHDMARFMKNQANDTRSLKAALVLLMTSPRIPIVYQGTEFA